MQTAVIPSYELFLKFFNGEEVKIPVLVFPDWMEDFQPGKYIEVYHIANNDEGHAHATGQVLKINGAVPSFPEGQPNFISITVKKA